MHATQNNTDQITFIGTAIAAFYLNKGTPTSMSRRKVIGSSTIRKIVTTRTSIKVVLFVSLLFFFSFFSFSAAARHCVGICCAVRSCGDDRGAVEDVRGAFMKPAGDAKLSFTAGGTAEVCSNCPVLGGNGSKSRTVVKSIHI